MLSQRQKNFIGAVLAFIGFSACCVLTLASVGGGGFMLYTSNEAVLATAEAEEVAARPTPYPTVTPRPLPAADQGTPVPSLRDRLDGVMQNNESNNGWEVTYETGATQMMRDFQFLQIVEGWAEFPDVSWPNAGFISSNGVEFGQELENFCQQDLRCDILVAARSYRVITGDRDTEPGGSCYESDGIGCGLIVFNMGDETAAWRDQSVHNGYTVTGLYWNGNEADQAMNGLASHMVYRMVGVPDQMPANPGSNCSVPTGCSGIDITIVVTSGNEVLLTAHTVYLAD